MWCISGGGRLAPHRDLNGLQCAQLPLSVLCVGNSRMVVPLLLLLQAACVFALGVGVWVVCNHFLTVDIPAAIGHPVKLRVLDCVFQLLMTWVSGVFYLSPRPEGEGGSWENILWKILVALMLLSQLWILTVYYSQI